jgi:hypothetical protein
VGDDEGTKHCRRYTGSPPGFVWSAPHAQAPARAHRP